MKLTFILLSVVLVILVYSRNVEGKTFHREENYIEETLCKNYALAKTERDLRGIKDVWNKIKENAIKSWNYVKKLAEQTKIKIELWTERVKEHAYKLKREFEEKLEELRQKLNSILNEIYGTGEIVQQCIIKEKENMETILMEIIKHMSACIAEEITKLVSMNKGQSAIAMNDTAFTIDLDQKMAMCERDKSNVNECLCKVREDIFDDLSLIENDILESNFEARSVADDIKGTLVTCSINNLIDSTDLITSEILEITKCVVDTKKNEEEPSEQNNFFLNQI